MMTAGVLVAAAVVSQHVLIHADDPDTFQPVRIVDQHPAALSQDRGVGGVPRNAQSLNDSGDRQVLESLTPDPSLNEVAVPPLTAAIISQVACG